MSARKFSCLGAEDLAALDQAMRESSLARAREFFSANRGSGGSAAWLENYRLEVERLLQGQPGTTPTLPGCAAGAEISEPGSIEARRESLRELLRQYQYRPARRFPRLSSFVSWLGERMRAIGAGVRRSDRDAVSAGSPSSSPTCAEGKSATGDRQSKIIGGGR
jgi:hypothetical protein